MWKAAAVFFCGAQLSYSFHVRQSKVLGSDPKRPPLDAGIDTNPVHEPLPTSIDKGPSLYVAVLSKRTSFGRRENVREMWQDGAKDWRTKGWGELKYQFVIGTASEYETPQAQELLAKESRTHGDVLIEENPEGYLDGLLTAKVFASLKTYLKRPSAPDLFMKVDDDTFVDFYRLRGLIRKYMSNGGDITKAFMGVYVRNNETLEPHQGIPCRDPQSIWFEPRTKFDEDLYPVAPQGGPGYILHKKMVEAIVHKGIAASNLINMEDKATGVWVEKLKNTGIDVDYVDVPGTNGYALLDRWIRGPYWQYPFVLHHHLDGHTIACLHRVAQMTATNNLTAKVDKCNFIKSTSPGDDAVCHDGRKKQPHAVVTEGWDFMKWELDQYGDQVPIKGSTRIFSSKRRFDKGHHFDDIDRVKGLKPIV